ncbi:hypothetical protein IA57_04125 [Mangrovimonas yunxiaonensis]|uniref:Uncharacterized protein n=1 Tax=Mangrovimonas yunxiaonensis TaxID=1197477 RepID=A0A084TLV1_9FLAO|nr:hypothetical protein [Mangrovimonas yunxiaonensis]KFB01687.1 hypothetical protein IA57_04125 [Mangrovimonas yunxiaonensis]GGH45560.1 hypothetical protein GCM10011364_19070 [Mangrovimonas yunxiaonensis]
MPELSNIQTYEKLNGNDIKPSVQKFAKVLERIGIWNSDLKEQFESLKWTEEDNGFVYLSNSDFGFYKTNFSEIKVRPLLMAWTPAIDKTFKNNWISCDLLIETETIRNFENGNYKELTFELIKKLVKEMAKEFSETGIYFTDEAQDGEDFDGIRTIDQNKLWNFDYALIPKKLKELYGENPKNYNINETDNWIESWNSDNWNEKIKVRTHNNGYK